MNSSPIRLRFSSGSSDAREGLEEPVGRLHVDEVDVELAAEGLFDLLGLAGPHEARCRRTRRSAGRRSPCGPGRRPPPSRPRRSARTAPGRCPPGPGPPPTADSMIETWVQAAGVPHTSWANRARNSEPRAVWTTSGWNWTPKMRRSWSPKAATGDPLALGQDVEAGRRLGHGVAVAHPHLALGRPVGEEGRGADEGEVGPSVLALAGAGDRARRAAARPAGRRSRCRGSGSRGRRPPGRARGPGVS